MTYTPRYPGTACGKRFSENILGPCQVRSTKTRLPQYLTGMGLGSCANLSTWEITCPPPGRETRLVSWTLRKLTRDRHLGQQPPDFRELLVGPPARSLRIAT